MTEQVIIQHTRKHADGRGDTITRGPFYRATDEQWKLAHFRNAQLDDDTECKAERIVTAPDERGGFWILAWHYIAETE